jgi:arginase
MKNPLAVSAVTKKLCDQVYEHSKEGRLVLTLGGDHSIAIGTIAGTAKAIRERLDREMAVIWVDAHTDINTPETSESGNVHGMPVAFLSGLAKEDREDVFGWLKKDNLISLKKLVYIGLRDVDRGEKLILREHGIKAFSMHDIDRYLLLLCCGTMLMITLQTRYRQSHGNGSWSHRQRYTYSSLLRRRCTGSNVGS